MSGDPYDPTAGEIAQLRARQAREEIAEETEQLQRRANGASGSLADAMAARSELKTRGISTTLADLFTLLFPANPFSAVRASLRW
jgi:hypothetical protein